MPYIKFPGYCEDKGYYDKKMINFYVTRQNLILSVFGVPDGKLESDL